MRPKQEGKKKSVLKVSVLMEVQGFGGGGGWWGFLAGFFLFRSLYLFCVAFVCLIVCFK